MSTPSPSPASGLRAQVDAELRGFLLRQRPGLLEIGEEMGPVLSALEDLLAGGKRMRPAFCYWGWHGAGGGDVPGIVTAAAALELLQASALIHDDVMDGSDTRRGLPSVHRRFAAMHDGLDWLGSCDAFGEGAAILLGDLCLAWSDEMYQGSGLSEGALRAGRPVFDIMRTEVMAGQYLDLVEQARGADSVAAALRVVTYKSAKYTIERPLHLGAALAGGLDGLGDVYSAYGLPLGVAFQLRDDVLGVFGDPEVTGKPAGDDLREGKRTVLVAMTLEAASATAAAEFRARLGDPALDDAAVARMREIITDSGALTSCERMIDDYAARASSALDSAPMADDARTALADLAVAATARRV